MTGDTDMEISRILQIEKGITSIVGGGGKTRLMLQLAKELAYSGTVIICTTTRIYPPDDVVLIISSDEAEIRKSVNSHGVICVAGGIDDNGKLIPPNVAIDRLGTMADYVICEADGARGLPLKAHGENEPVIPIGTNQTILVMGIDGIGKEISSTCHRPSIYAGLVGVSEDSVVTPELAMKVANSEGYGTRILINKVETKEQMEVANAMRRYATVPVVAGSIRNGEYACL